MPFTSYSDLQTAITNWLAGRTDLSSYYADYVTLFEAHAARRLRVRSMESTVSLSVSSGVASLPSDYLGWKRLTWTGNPNTNLEYATPDWVQINYPDSSASGPPSVFTIIGSNINVRPVDSTALSLTYYAKNTAVASTLNWLFNNHPGAYLFGALTEAAAFTADDQMLAIWKARRDEVMQEVETFYFREPGRMRIRVAGTTP